MFHSAFNSGGMISTMFDFDYRLKCLKTADISMSKIMVHSKIEMGKLVKFIPLYV